jgi:toxin-antitoxin system PIN domain toxin
LTLADVNVLLAALRRDHIHHQSCHAWLENEVNSGARFGVAPNVLSSVVRIATNARAFAKPSTLDEVLAFADTLLSAPDAVVVAPGAGHWSIFTGLLRATSAKGGLVADAWFAALAIEWGCTWVTLDRDYARFTQLTVREP